MFAPLLLSLSLAARPQVLVVDAAGGGDFTSLPAAVEAAPAGAVLWVLPGDYEAFVATRRLTILGPGAGPAPRVAGASRVEGAAAFRLAGLELERLELVGVPDRVELDALAIGPWKLAALELTDCADVLLERSAVTGAVHDYAELLAGGPPAAIRATGSRLTLVASSAVGADGASSTGLPDLCARGAAGLRLDGGSALVVTTSLEGGRGGLCQTLFSFEEPGGSGLELFGAAAVVRGDGQPLLGGLDGFGSSSAPSVRGDAGATLVLSGVPAPQGLALSGGTLVLPPAQPFLELLGGDAPGSTRRLFVHAPAGETLFLWAGLAGGPLAVPGLEGAVALDLTSAFPLSTVRATGFATPVVLRLPLPADLAPISGQAVTLQALAPGVPGALDPTAVLGTNPVALVLRF